MATSCLRSSLVRVLGRTSKSGAPRWGQIISRGYSDEASDTDDSTPSTNDFSQRQFRAPAFQGVYKAVILGEVTQPPFHHTLKNGKSIINLMVATGGLRVQKKPEAPTKQIHKVVIYDDRLKELASKRVKKGQQIHLEGNMESRVFNDPVTGAVKLSREISLRQNGRLFLINDLALKGVNHKVSEIDSS